MKPGKLPHSFVKYWVERYIAKISSILMQIFPSLFKMTASRIGGFPDYYQKYGTFCARAILSGYSLDN